jgi:hypothetical protein
MIIAVYVLVASTAAPVMYNYWAILGLDIFAIVFWIISFSLLGSEVAAHPIVNYSVDDCLYSYLCYYKRNIDGYTTKELYTYRNSMAAASGLGGLELYVFSFFEAMGC